MKAGFKMDAKEVFAFNNQIRIEPKSNEFKRMFYYSLLDFALDSTKKFCALLGPRKIGKTIALDQLQKELLKKGFRVLLINFATIDYNYYIDDLTNLVLSSISNTTYDFIILDEITYVPKYDNFISNLGDTSRKVFSSVKIILTGFSEAMILAACRRDIATQIVYVKATFLNFVEYLAYTGKIENYDRFRFLVEDLENCMLENLESATIENFDEYVKNAWKFSNFTSLKEYLQSCIEENVVSNNNCVYETRDSVSGEKSSDFTICILCLCLYYAYSSSVCQDAKNVEIIQKGWQQIFGFLNECVQAIEKYNFTDVKEALKLLYDCRLICFQSINNEIGGDELLNWFIGRSEYLAGERIVNITSFFKYINVLVVSPLPFAGLLQDLLLDVNELSGISLSLSDVLTGSLLGSFIETFLKGSYCDTQGYYCITELHDEQQDAEIDLVDFRRQMMYEMSVTDKHISKTWFSAFPEYNYFTKILVGKQKTNIVQINEEELIHRVPYPIFVFWLNSIYYARLRSLLH